MPRIRELRISTLALSLQRCAICSPSRLTTASRPLRASAGAGSSEGAGQFVRRDSSVTSSPRSRSALTTALPIVPVAPVTATRIS